jgi:hypothetical protein
MTADWREHGDRVLAETAHMLCTPYTLLRKEPVSRVYRMHAEAGRIARALAGR